MVTRVERVDDKHEKDIPLLNQKSINRKKKKMAE